MSSDTVGPDETLQGLKGDERVIAEAKDRFRRCADWESETRARALDDLKFSLGDPDNGWQWPDGMLNSRDDEQKVSLTLNKVRVHCLQIENETRKNKPSVNIRPTGNGATYEAAQVFEGIVRHIEYISRAQSAYITANKFQVRCGVGYTRIVTDYLGENTFDQEIFIRRVKDPTTIYLDPDINEEDGLDARFGFVFDDIPKDEFRSKYPGNEDVSASSAIGDGLDLGYITEDHVRVVEYFRKVEVRDQLCQALDPITGALVTVQKSKVPAEVWDALMATMDKKHREVTSHKVEWYSIAGQKVLDKRDWPGIYIPIFRAVGEETVVEKQLDRKGHVRNMKDAQRQYNFWASATTESIALQPVQPWILDPTSIEENESVWGTANSKKHAYLPWKKYDDQGRELPEPQRVAPPNVPQALIEGMNTAQQEMMMTTGQYQAQMGENENAKSGKAISERQAQGDNATYHFTDGMAVMIRAIGKALVDLIPKIYDSPGRIIKILAEDMTEEELQIDPNAKQAYVLKQRQEGQNVRAIFNPTVGTYDVEADIGPDYATKRQEAFNALTQLMAANKELVLVAGDLLMKAADFPMADELAERLRRMVPPQALGEGPPPQIQQQLQELTQQNTSLSHTVAELTKVIAEKSIEAKNKAAEMQVKAYEAETHRIHQVAESQRDVNEHDRGMKELEQRSIAEARSFSLDRLQAQTAQSEQNEPSAESSQSQGSM